MKKLFLSRPTRFSSYGYSSNHKRDYSRNKTLLRFPWANKSFMFYPEIPNSRDGDGYLDNYWNQGCKLLGNYLSNKNLDALQKELLIYEDYQKQIKKLECEYNAWLTGRYTRGAHVDTGCDSLTFEADNKIPSRLRCVHGEKENLAKGRSRASSWRSHYKNPALLQSFQQRITELETQIQYEKDQAENLEEDREELGITQEYLYQLYPQAQEIIEILAPQASSAQTFTEDLGEFDDKDGDGDNDNTDITNREKKKWVITGIGFAALSLVAFIASKKLK